LPKELALHTIGPLIRDEAVLRPFLVSSVSGQLSASTRLLSMRIFIPRFRFIHR